MQKLYIFLIVVLCINLSLQVSKHQLKKAKSTKNTECTGGQVKNEQNYCECPTGKVSDWDQSIEEMRCMACDEVLKGSTLNKWGICSCPEFSDFQTNQCLTCAENDQNSEPRVVENDYIVCYCKDGFDWGYEGKCEKIECKRKGTVWNAAKHYCECPTGERWNWDNKQCEVAVCNKIPGTVFDEMSKHCECPKFHHISHKKVSKKHASDDTTATNGNDADETQLECKFQCSYNDREEKDGDCVCKENSHEYVPANTSGTSELHMGAQHVPDCQCDVGFGRNPNGNGGCQPCVAPKTSEHGSCSCPAMMRANLKSQDKECICDEYSGVIEGENGDCQCPEGQSWVYFEGSNKLGWCQQATATL